jgi:hypothetical protein
MTKVQRLYLICLFYSGERRLTASLTNHLTGDEKAYPNQN